MTVPTSPASGANPTSQGGNAQVPPPVEMVEAKIDGIPVSVPKGTLIIRAAEQLGIEIPRFCDHPLLEPAGACRQCLVDVAMPGRDGKLSKMPKPQASCTMTVTPGMEVETQLSSPVAEKAQRGVMEFLLINHPLDCPVCDKGGECPLQNQALSHGQGESRFTDVKRTYPKPVNVSTQVLLDRERCVLCQRCTRFSDQIAGDPFISLTERGANSQIGIFQDKPFQSYFSGNTVQICPVGALTSATYRFRSRPFDLVSTSGICEHCSAGCHQRTDHRRGTVLRRMVTNTPAVNEEWNCDKGRWGFAYQTQPDRYASPQVRGTDGVLRVASWPEALEAAARGLARAREVGGVGVLTGGRLTAEDAYAYAKFARLALGTNDIDFRARPHTDEEEAFLTSHVVATAPGSGAVTYTDLEKASAVLLVGLEPEEEVPMVFLRLRKAARKNKTRVFSIAPFASSGLVKLMGTLVQAAPGTEAGLLAAVAEGRSELAAVAEALTDEAVILVGERLATTPGALSAAVALAERTGARLAWIPRRAGERSALEAGALPSLLPGGRPLSDEGARAEVAAAWGVPSLPGTRGRDGRRIVADAASGRLPGLLVGGVEPGDLPDPDLVHEALRRAFVVSLDLRAGEMTEYADVVLPVSPHDERSGAFVNWEGRLGEFGQALKSHAMSDHRVLDLVAGEMGVYLGTANVAATRAEMHGMGTWNGPRATAPSVPAEGLSTLRDGEAVLATWHHLLDAGVMQDGEPFLAGTAKPAVARLSPATAAEIGVTDGDPLTVSTRRGAITLPVAVTSMVDHVVWLPTNSPRSRVRAGLGAVAGDVVTLSKGGVA
ncbi:NADH-quinone oxidoreductase subunit G [Mobilicoccus pelagius]|uniref:NADH-quinone oxidoreductase n=1 Tax=Mobilicoccus pelagius NBRC 104925 TaxID=1089455 RepID=H5UQC6_9MICO|nr:NADH-quinone oxidoreductase subunit G [Mobilicoccus pelagius]GAB47934.1 NADH-quinone oxidoreductase chain G [Mobilicoccus pelagius NBRC 104925]